MSTSSFEEVNDLSFTERRLFSLFASYPEITFDPEGKDTGVDPHRLKGRADVLNSSPISTLADDGDKSQISDSTAHTTPLRPLHLLQPQRPNNAGTVAGYLRQVRQTDLPEECRLCFTSLAQSIGALSAGMVPSTNGRYRINNTYFTDQCSVLLREVQILSDRTKEQVKQVSSLKSLFIFKAVPSDDMLCAMYRQRAQLIIRLTALPSSTEHHLIHNLARLFNASLYGPSQLLYDDDEIEFLTMRIFNKLYDRFFTWLTNYKQWCNAMRELKEKYMTPLVARILASEPVRMEIQGVQRAKRKAEVALVNPVGPSMLPMDERVLKALNLSARRKEAVVKKGKTRSRREKTI